MLLSRVGLATLAMLPDLSQPCVGEDTARMSCGGVFQDIADGLSQPLRLEHHYRT
jgi:hypothetical protein